MVYIYTFGLEARVREIGGFGFRLAYFQLRLLEVLLLFLLFLSAGPHFDSIIGESWGARAPMIWICSSRGWLTS